MAHNEHADRISAALAARPTLGGELMFEIERYLAAVAVFRALGCEPQWAPEARA